MSMPRILGGTALGIVGILSLAGCSGQAAAEPEQTTPAASTVTVEDNNGTQEIATPPASVVATDNRTFQTLDDWGIKLSAAAVSLMPDTVSYKKDASIVDTGNHREPNLEKIVAANPDLVIVGQRYTGHRDKILPLVPNAAVITLDPREDKPLDEELKRQVNVLGEIFGKQAEAKKLGDDFDAAVKRVKDAWNPDDTVMALNSSGGNLGYISPDPGRTLGELVGFLGLKQALTVDNAGKDHQGDEVSVEAIAKANPTWVLVMDRDVAVAATEPGFKPAAEVITGSEALKNVTAVKQKQIVYMPEDTYLNEGIQTYTEFLNSFADALEAKNKKG